MPAVDAENSRRSWILDLSPVAGGLVILVLLTALVLTNRGLRHYDALEPAL